MKHKDAILYISLQTLGNFLVLFALYGVGIVFGPIAYYEIRYQFNEWDGIHYIVEPDGMSSQENSQPVRPQYRSLPKISAAPNLATGFDRLLRENQEQILIPANTQFSITIPKLGVSARIFPNVDPNNSSSYGPVLTRGIAQAKGSVFPGMRGNVYLFAHSTDNWWDVSRYNAVFYLLKDMAPGDTVIVFFENVRYDYTVTKTEILPPSDVSLLTQNQLGSQRLVLQTCWPPGTSWERLYVIAVPKST